MAKKNELNQTEKLVQSIVAMIEMLKEKPMTLYEVADKLGISYDSVYRYKNMIRNLGYYLYKKDNKYMIENKQEDVLKKETCVFDRYTFGKTGVFIDVEKHGERAVLTKKYMKQKFNSICL